MLTVSGPLRVEVAGRPVPVTAGRYPLREPLWPRLLVVPHRLGRAHLAVPTDLDHADSTDVRAKLRDPDEREGRSC